MGWSPWTIGVHAGEAGESVPALQGLEMVRRRRTSVPRDDVMQCALLTRVDKSVSLLAACGRASQETRNCVPHTQVFLVLYTGYVSLKKNCHINKIQSYEITPWLMESCLSQRDRRLWRKEAVLGSLLL